MTMVEPKNLLSIKGVVKRTIYQADKAIETIFHNTLLDGGRRFLLESLLQGNRENIFINKMLFGGGAAGKQLHASQNELFDMKIAKPVIGQKDPKEKNLLVFTAVVKNEELNGETLNEMALQLSNNDLYCMLL